MTLEATSQGLMTPIAEAPAPVQPPDYEDYGEEEDMPIITDDMSSDSEESVIAQTNQSTQQAAALSKQSMRIFEHLKPPMFLQEEPVWLREVIEAMPVFCGLLSLTLTKGIEILETKDFEHLRSVIIYIILLYTVFLYSMLYLLFISGINKSNGCGLVQI